MRTVWNKTRRPLKVPLEGGHVLHLGPDKTGNVSDHALELPSFQRLIEHGEIELLDEPDSTEEQQRPRPGRQPRHGYQQRKAVLPSGGRTAGGKRER